MQHSGSEMLFPPLPTFAHDGSNSEFIAGDDSLPTVSFLDAHLEDQGLRNTAWEQGHEVAAFMPPATSAVNDGQGCGGATGTTVSVEEDNTSLRAISKYLMQEREDLMQTLDSVSSRANNMRALARLLEHQCRPKQAAGSQLAEGQGLSKEDLNLDEEDLHLDVGADHLMVIEGHASTAQGIDSTTDASMSLNWFAAGAN